jgi:hypothetical protein
LVSYSQSEVTGEQSTAKTLRLENIVHMPIVNLSALSSHRRAKMKEIVFLGARKAELIEFSESEPALTTSGVSRVNRLNSGGQKPCGIVDAVASERKIEPDSFFKQKWQL